ncbi:carbohydrate ABC transporter membrane protein 2, CUT1 family (TC 3.A.1.1.-) [Arthrobacter sp. ov407]|uniref:carbohydrate ABC transporter permease n=1 Tax=Arthrobacter sp. ov407 TaxID=1761748 RepID=UPI0008920D61|nr:carbohydrate ABC transporter permease [Arthrobacter sp. ov407]SDL18983.1 carbohydrate ABC transporter membrane protein 2, CUT1 family (TC 3.A.1.1.-) [Arthrobacter sp. ov407]
MSDSAIRAGRRVKRGRNAIAHVVLGGGGLLMIAPLIYQVIMSISTNAEVQSIPPTFWPSEVQWHNFADVFTVMNFGSSLRVSVLITMLRVVGQVILCSLAGYAFARMRFRGRGAILAVILSILMVPGQLFLIPQFQIVQNLGWLNTIAGIVAPGLFSAFGVFLMRQFFMGLPDELEDAARLDGANPFQIFSKIMMPLAANGLWALAIITVLWSWNDLLWPLVIASTQDAAPLSVGLANLQGEHANNYPILMAASLMAMAPILILFIAMQKKVMAGIGRSGLK